MIENFINSALIIDDKEEQISELRTLLESKDIWVKHEFPKDLLNVSIPLKNRKIIFLDLYLSETATELKGHISEIRKILMNIIGKDFGTYGIVLWSSHIDEIDILKEKIQLDRDKYNLPAFVIGLSKKKYLTAGSYSTLLSDLDDELSKNTAANFFIHWDSLVNRGKDFTIENIYSLCKDYKTQEEDLKFILFKLAQNHIGVPTDKLESYDLEHDAIKAFSDMLRYEIDTKFTGTNTLFTPQPIFSGDDEEKRKVYAKINSRILLDTVNVTQNIVVPGNIYKIIDDNSIYKINGIPDDALPIVIEISPPCDFANNNKMRSRVIGGFITEYSKGKREKFKKEYHYKEIWPIRPLDDDTIKLIIFDFRYFGTLSESDLTNENCYKILYRAKDKLFADILQKLSSHTAKLGLSVIH